MTITVVLVSMCVLGKWACQDGEGCLAASSMGDSRGVEQRRGPENVGEVEGAVTTLLRKRQVKDLAWESKSSRLTGRVTGE